MTVLARPHPELDDAAPRSGTARAIVRIGIGCVLLLGCLCLAASFLPGGVFVGRLLGSFGDARASAATADVAAHIGERMRVLGVLLVALSASLLVVRTRLSELLDATVTDVRALRLPPRLDALALVAASVLALAMRAPFASQPMRYDEAMTVNDFAVRPLHVGLSYYPDPNNHLLNTLLVHVAFVLFGNQPWLLRLPALLAGALLAPATYVLATVLYDRRVAIVAAALVAVASYLVEYSTNARGYTLQALCFLIVAASVVVAVRRDCASPLLPAGVVAALGAYAVPTMVYGLAVALAWFAVLRFQPRRPPGRVRMGHGLAMVLLAGTVATIAYAPVIVVSGPDKLIANRYVASLSGSDLVRELPASLGRTWADFNQDVPLPIAALLALGFAIATFTDIRRRHMPLGLLAATVCLACVLVQRVAPFERVWLFLLPLYLMVATAGLATLARGRTARWGGALLAVACTGGIIGSTLTSGAIVASPETGAFPDAEVVAGALASRLRAGDAVITSVPASAPQIEYYLARAGSSIDALRRSPDADGVLYVVSLPSEMPQVAGWTNPQPIERFSGSRLLRLERAAS